MTVDAGNQAGSPPPLSEAIDVHHHIVPPFYREAMARSGLGDPIENVDYPTWEVADSLAMMERQGVASAVVSITDPGVYFADVALAIELAREMNEYMAGLIADHPGRFGAFGVLPLPDPDAALAELPHALDELGLDGIGVFTNYRGTYLGDPRFDELFAELHRRGTVIHVHPAVPPAGDQPSFGLPPSLYEFTFETTRLAAQLLYSGTLERYPELQLILSHAGGAVPYLCKRLTYAPTIAAHLTERALDDPIGALQRLHYDTAMAGSPYSLPSLRAFVEPSQILIGTDFPFMPEWSGRENNEALVRHGEFTQEELSRVQRDNAAVLFPRLAAAS